MTKEPSGTAGTGANPADRDKKGKKRSILTDGKDMPLLVTDDEANRHDKKSAKETLDGIIIQKLSSDNVIRNTCMDKRYDFPDIRQFLKNMVILPISKNAKKKA